MQRVYPKRIFIFFFGEENPTIKNPTLNSCLVLGLGMAQESSSYSTSNLSGSGGLQHRQQANAETNAMIRMSVQAFMGLEFYPPSPFYLPHHKIMSPPHSTTTPIIELQHVNLTSIPICTIFPPPPHKLSPQLRHCLTDGLFSST